MKRRGEIKRRFWRCQKFFFFVSRKKKKKIEPVQNILYWFKTKLYQRYKLNYYIYPCNGTFLRMFISRGITPGNFWCIVCATKLSQKFHKTSTVLKLLAEITLVCLTDLLTRSCRLILYGSAGLTISKISSWNTKHITAIQFLVEYYIEAELPLRKHDSWVLSFYYCELIMNQIIK